MSMKKSKNQISKKKARQKAVKKIIVENRLIARKEKRLEYERELAYEREFAEKQNLGLSADEIKSRLSHNLQILDALEKQLEEEEADKGENISTKNAQEQLAIIEEFGTMHKELIDLNFYKKELEEKGEFTEEKKAKWDAKSEEIKQKIQELDAKQKSLALPT
jgi:hypothetical protein